MDLQVGDRITYKYLNTNIDKDKIYVSLVEGIRDAEIYKEMIESETKTSSIEILKIERPNYEVIEEKKELLTEEEREFLKQYIKFCKFYITHIHKTSNRFYFYNNMNLVETMEKKENCFNNLETGSYYSLLELGLD